MKKCSNEEHKEIEAKLFCEECKLYLCDKCEIYHSELFKNHHQYIIDKDKVISEIYTGLCKEENHFEQEYFCKSHNELCCAKCILTKIKSKNIGQHKDCDVCLIEDIENEKKNQLKDNIKLLEDLSNNLQQSINEIKIIIEKIDNNKEELKKNIQNIFTKIRNAINDREDQLLLDVDNKYNELYFNENIIKNSGKLPIKIKIFLEKGKVIEKQWKENNKLNSLINDCLNIENNINDIKKINDNIKKYQLNNEEINFISNEEEINKIIGMVKKFGNINIKTTKIFDSKIKFDEELFKSWLDKKHFKVELLFRKTRDGSSFHDFHNKCDNKGITVVFIETTKGYKFGGYTELQWDNHSGGKRDKSTFLFSFNNKQKYTVQKDLESIYCQYNSCPWFGNGSYPEIYFPSSLNKGQTWDSNNTFFNGRKLTNGEENWDVKQLEAFKIIYI